MNERTIESKFRMTSVAAIEAWLVEEARRLDKRLAEASNRGERDSLRGSILTVQKLQRALWRGYAEIGGRK